MGAALSVTNVDTDVLNETITETITVNNNKVDISKSSFQDLNMEGVKALSCTLDIVQEIKGTFKIVQKVDSDVQQTVIAHIVENLELQLKNSAKAESAFASLPSLAVSVTNVKQHVHNLLSNKLSVENLNETIIKIQDIQNVGMKDVTLDPCGYSLYPNGPPEFAVKACGKPKCKIGQDIQTELLVENIIKNVIESISEDDTVIKLLSDITTSSDAKSKGFFDGLSDLFSQFKWILLGIVLLITLGGIAMMVLKPKETAAAMNKVVNKTAQSINKAVNAAAAVSVKNV